MLLVCFFLSLLGLPRTTWWWRWEGYFKITVRTKFFHHCFFIWLDFCLFVTVTEALWPRTLDKIEGKQFLENGSTGCVLFVSALWWDDPSLFWLSPAGSKASVLRHFILTIDVWNALVWKAEGLALPSWQKNCVQKERVRWEFKSSHWCEVGMSCGGNYFAAFLWVLVFFF